MEIGARSQRQSLAQSKMETYVMKKNTMSRGKEKRKNSEKGTDTRFENEKETIRNIKTLISHIKRLYNCLGCILCC